MYQIFKTKRYIDIKLQKNTEEVIGTKKLFMFLCEAS
jgi:hypothetical protein